MGAAPTSQGTAIGYIGGIEDSKDNGTDASEIGVVGSNDKRDGDDVMLRMRAARRFDDEHVHHVLSVLLPITATKSAHFREQQKETLTVERALSQIEELKSTGIEQLGILHPHVVQGEADVLANDGYSRCERKAVVQNQPRLLLDVDEGQ